MSLGKTLILVSQRIAEVPPHPPRAAPLGSGTPGVQYLPSRGAGAAGGGGAGQGDGTGSCGRPQLGLRCARSVTDDLLK